MRAARLRLWCAGLTLVVGGTAACTGDPRPDRTAEKPRVRFREVAADVGLGERQSVRRTRGTCLFNPERLRRVLPAVAVAGVTGAGGDQCLPERMSGGAAVGDYDRDGWDDLYLTSLDRPGRLYRNRGGRFVDVTDGVGLDVLPAGSNGAVWGDIDNDGDPDLYVTMLATTRYYLFENLGRRGFVERGLERGAALAQDRVHSGFTPTFGDVDGDGWLDLFVTEWASPEWAPNTGISNQRLLRNLGAEGRAGEFADVTIPKGVATETAALPVLGFGARLTDLDGDRRADLVLASDFRTSKLFWNDGDRFTDGTVAAGVGTDENGMGLTVADYDGDGRRDVFITSIFGTTPPCDGGYCGYAISGNRLYRNLGGRRFEDVTDLEGVRDGGWGWGAAFVDAANTGRLDLVMVSGVEFPFAPSTERYQRGGIRFWRQDPRGGFRERAGAVGLVASGPGKAVAVLDFDRDGRQDVLVVRDGGRPQLWQNVTRRSGRWLGLRVLDSHGRSALGAEVTVEFRTAVRSRRAVTVAEVGSVTGFLGQSSELVHVGLGRGPRRGEPVRIVVRYPDGSVERRSVREFDRTVTVSPRP